MSSEAATTVLPRKQEMCIACGGQVEGGTCHGGTDPHDIGGQFLKLGPSINLQRKLFLLLIVVFFLDGLVATQKQMIGGSMLQNSTRLSLKMESLTLKWRLFWPWDTMPHTKLLTGATKYG